MGHNTTVCSRCCPAVGLSATRRMIDDQGWDGMTKEKWVAHQQREREQRAESERIREERRKRGRR